MGVERSKAETHMRGRGTEAGGKPISGVAEDNSRPPEGSAAKNRTDLSRMLGVEGGKLQEEKCPRGY